ncbi:MAG TPA: PilZ domain-containing protein [Verrucomicrobiae bacterium]|jgi:PilZ domain|nr:PilZ domain-containing protein [Verrucomicrobiae bacterium]
MSQEQRGLRFAFEERAEVVVEGSTEKIPARVTELSFRGCFLEIKGLSSEGQRLQVRIFHEEQFFEASAKVIYVRATGVGLMFADMKPHCRNVLQTWILAALDKSVKVEKA